MLGGTLGYGVFAEVPRSPILLVEQGRNINRNVNEVSKSDRENHSLIPRENLSKVEKYHRCYGPRRVEKSWGMETPRTMSLKATSVLQALRGVC